MSTEATTPQDRPSAEAPAFDVSTIHVFGDIPLNHFNIMQTRVSGGKRITVFTTRDRVIGYALVDVVDKRFSLNKEEVVKAATDAKMMLADAAPAAIGEAVARINAGGDPKTISPVQIAQGRPKQDGEDAKLIWHVDIGAGDGASDRVTFAENEQANYREVRRVPNVPAGEKILTIEPPTKGVAGVDVFGKPIPAKDGAEKIFDAGDGVIANDTKTEFTAREAGAVCLDGKSIVVSPVMKLKAVDFTCGNVEYHGQVEVAQDVGEGFTVKAGREITVGGDVKDATLTAGRAIKLQALLGRAASATCQGDFTAVRVVNAKVRAAGAANIVQELVNADLHCCGPLNATEAAMVGGSVVSLGPVYLRSIGSESQTAGTQSVVIDLDALEAGELADMRHKMNDLGAAAAKIRTALGQIAENPAIVQKLPPAKRGPLVKLIEQLQAMESQKAALENELKIASAPLRKRLKTQVFAKRISAGTTITLSGISKSFADAVDHPVIVSLERGKEALKVSSWLVKGEADLA